MKQLHETVACVFAGRSIYRQVFSRKLPERNELFLPGRMAYVVDLEDDFTESDVPTTLIRSKADCPSLEVIDPQCLLTHSVYWPTVFIAVFIDSPCLLSQSGGY